MEGELPGYTPRAGNSHASQDVLPTGSERTISLEDNKGHKWLLLSVKSRAPTPNSLPAFYAGDLISGNVTLDILKSESSKAIVLKVSH
jgi:hypothetical protein